MFAFKIILTLSLVTAGVLFFCIFFDQAVLMRRGTIFRVKTVQKKIALTFDDGPSPEWTPQILKELKKADIKATFFMIGHHVKKYPEVARQVAQEGHTIGNHGYAHSVVFYYTPAEIEEEIKYTEYVIKETTGQITRYFRPPKAWLTQDIKNKIKSMDYDVVLWSINSKDWVNFPHRHVVNKIAKKIQPGDIILFHDSGNVLSPEGGNRQETVLAIALLAKKLKEKGFEFGTLEELLGQKSNYVLS